MVTQDDHQSFLLTSCSTIDTLRVGQRNDWRQVLFDNPLRRTVHPERVPLRERYAMSNNMAAGYSRLCSGLM
jgi:hypothetical protein